MVKKERLASVMEDTFKRYFEREGRIEPHSGKYKMRPSDAGPLSETVVNAIERYILKKLREDGSFSFKDERNIIKATSKMYLQKKQKRIVINLPEWLKDRLKERADQSSMSMNEIIRTSLVDYLAED